MGHGLEGSGGHHMIGPVDQLQPKGSQGIKLYKL